MTENEKGSKRTKFVLKVVEQSENINLDHVQSLIKASLDDNVEIILEGIKEIEECKREIESWYQESDHNISLIMGVDPNKELNHLAKLREWKPFREKKYNWFEKRNLSALERFVNLICNNPDIGFRGYYKGKKRDTKLTTLRDLRDQTEREISKLYKQAEEKIKKCVERENRRLKSKHHHFSIYPITVKISSHMPTTHVYTHRVKEIVTLFIEELSKLLKPYKKKQIDRAKFISEVFQYFYGLPEADNLDTIRKHC